MGSKYCIICLLRAKKKNNGHVTPKAKSDKVDRVTKEETYRPRDA